MSQQYQKQKVRWKEQARKEREKEIIKIIKDYRKASPSDKTERVCTNLINKINIKKDEK